MKLPNFMFPLYRVGEHNKKFRFPFLNSDTVLSDSENFANIWQIKWNWIRSMKFATVQIYLLSEFSVCCHPKILLPWQHDVTTSPLSGWWHRWQIEGGGEVASNLFTIQASTSCCKTAHILNWRHTSITLHTSSHFFVGVQLFKCTGTEQRYQ